MVQYKKEFFWQSINMSISQQNEIQNEIEWVKREINLLQDRLKKNRKNQFQNVLVRVKKIRIKKKTKQTKTGFFFRPKEYKI